MAMEPADGHVLLSWRNWSSERWPDGCWEELPNSINDPNARAANR